MHTKYVVGNSEWNSQLGRSRRGWRIKEGQNEYLDLQAIIYIVFNQKIVCFCFVTSTPNARSNKFLVINYLQNFSYLF
jgi:hypothetical protein